MELQNNYQPMQPRQENLDQNWDKLTDEEKKLVNDDQWSVVVIKGCNVVNCH